MNKSTKENATATKLYCLGRRARARGLAWIIIIIIIIVASAFASFAAEAALEYKVKAGFIYNFVKFVEWPVKSPGTSNSSVVVGVLADDIAAPVLQQVLGGKSVNGLALEVRLLKEVAEARNCNLLFIGRAQENRIKEILDFLKAAPVLTVSETEGFGQLGGMINFVRNDDSFRLEINLQAADRAGFKISSKLSSVATIVRTTK